MKDDGLAIFLYDLVILGRKSLMLDEAFMNYLYDYTYLTLDENRLGIKCIAHCSFNKDDYKLYIYADDIISASEKFTKLIKNEPHSFDIFGNFSVEQCDAIGSLAVGFNNYLSHEEKMIYNETSLLYRYLKQ